MKKNIKVCLILFTIILMILMINFSIILNKTGIIKKEKQIQKEMSSRNKEVELNTQLSEANKSATEYANYVQTCKTQLASTISNEGVPTSEDDTFEKMVTNIGDIFTQRTKLDESIAATADNISKGKQAYVNGELITGTGEDNNSFSIVDTKTYSSSTNRKNFNFTFSNIAKGTYIVFAYNFYESGYPVTWGPSYPSVSVTNGECKKMNNNVHLIKCTDTSTITVSVNAYQTSSGYAQYSSAILCKI